MEGVSMLVLRRKPVDLVPGTDVTPSKIPANHIRVRRFFHYAVIDGDPAHQPVGVFKALIEERSSEGRLNAHQVIIQFRKRLLDFFQDHICPPNEYAAVPEEVTALDKFLCSRKVWLLCKRLNLEHPLRQHSAVIPLLVNDLNIAVAGFRVRRLNSDSDQGGIFVCDVYANFQDPEKFLFIENDMVGRQNYHHSVRV